MITVDPRAGSKTLIKPLRALGLRVVVETLDYADVAFIGNGPDGPVQVGIELKTVPDILDCIKSGRFAGHQLPGLIDCYGVVILLVQGRWRAGRNGALEIEVPGQFRQAAPRWVRPKGRDWLYRHLRHWLSSIKYQGGIHIEYSDDVAGSAAYIRAEVSWWTVKEWADHQTLKVFNESGAVPMVKPTVCAAMAKRVYGIGWDKAHAIGRHFGSPQVMANASANAWAEIPGIGKELARRAVRAMQVEGVR